MLVKKRKIAVSLSQKHKPEGYMTLREYAKRHRLSYNQITNLVNSCRIDYIRINDYWLYIPEDAKVKPSLQHRNTFTIYPSHSNHPKDGPG